MNCPLDVHAGERARLSIVWFLTFAACCVRYCSQFYTFVNKEPSRLHRFYTKRSTLIHGTEGEECAPRYGQQVRLDLPR